MLYRHCVVSLVHQASARPGLSPGSPCSGAKQSCPVKVSLTKSVEGWRAIRGDRSQHEKGRHQRPEFQKALSLGKADPVWAIKSWCQSSQVLRAALLRSSWQRCSPCPARTAGLITSAYSVRKRCSCLFSTLHVVLSDLVERGWRVERKAAAKGSNGCRGQRIYPVDVITIPLGNGYGQPIHKPFTLRCRQ